MRGSAGGAIGGRTEFRIALVVTYEPLLRVILRCCLLGSVSILFWYKANIFYERTTSHATPSALLMDYRTVAEMPGL